MRIAVAQDAEGLKIAALELLEDGFAQPQREANERLAEISSDPESLLRAAPSKRTLSPGYYLWLGYVAEAIEGPLEAGISFHCADLDAGELVTLGVLREARAEFRKKHPPCQGCGRLLPTEWDNTCPDCARKT